MALKIDIDFAYSQYGKDYVSVPDLDLEQALSHYERLVSEGYTFVAIRIATFDPDWDESHPLYETGCYITLRIHGHCPTRVRA